MKNIEIHYRKSRRNFSKRAIEILSSYFFAHMDYPYPNDEQKEKLAKECNISAAQVFFKFLFRFERYLYSSFRWVTGSAISAFATVRTCSNCKRVNVWMSQKLISTQTVSSSPYLIILKKKEVRMPKLLQPAPYRSLQSAFELPVSDWYILAVLQYPNHVTGLKSTVLYSTQINRMFRFTQLLSRNSSTNMDSNILTRIIHWWRHLPRDAVKNRIKVYS